MFASSAVALPEPVGPCAQLGLGGRGGVLPVLTVGVQLRIDRRVLGHVTLGLLGACGRDDARLYGLDCLLPHGVERTVEPVGAPVRGGQLLA